MKKKSQEQVAHELSLFCKGADQVVHQEELRRKIASGKTLKVKLGLDPTAPDIHLGHSVVLRKLRQFQEWGHEAHIILGDFTGQIGDPSGKSKTRPQLSKAEVIENAKTYEEQIKKILKTELTKIHFNSSWLETMTFKEVLQLSSFQTVARMLERDDFKKRFNGQKPISIHEFFYPLIQGYDSVMLEADVEIGGTDQTFNVLMGRHLQKMYHQEEQCVILMPLLEGTDGIEKMSKSLNNYIGIHEEPNEIFGKVMSIQDEMMVRYYQLTTDFHPDHITEIEGKLQRGECHPRDVKLDLATEIVRIYHGEEAAGKARQHFISLFSERKLPTDLPEILVENDKVDILNIMKKEKIITSNSEGRRLFNQGAIAVNQNKVAFGEMVEFKDGDILKIGKKKFYKVKMR